jgi:hypothetical protein
MSFNLDAFYAAWDAQKQPIELLTPPAGTNGATPGSAYAQAALTAEIAILAATPEGERNEQLNKSGFNLFTLVPVSDLTETEVTDWLTATAHSIGLTPSETRNTIRSSKTGLNHPRTLPAATSITPPPVTVLNTPTEETDDQPLVATWAAQPLDDILDGTYTPEQPTLMPRNDNICLLYAGRVHSLHGESESGKSMVAQAETTRLLTNGHNVLYIDFESDRAAIIGRLLELGAHRDNIRTHLTYLHPETDPRRFPHEREAVTTHLQHRYTLAIIDGVTDALGTFGASSKDNDEVTTFMRILPRTIATHTGAAVVLIDHVTKDADNRGRFAIGGQAKMAALDGAAYIVETTEPIGRGMKGTITLRAAKDRPGGVRANCGNYRKTDRTQEAARITIDSTAGGDIITTIIEPPRMADETGPEFRPTHLMERASMFVEAATTPVTRNDILDAINGRKDSKIQAIAYLVRDGYLKVTSGPNRAHLHSSVKPFREHQIEPWPQVGPGGSPVGPGPTGGGGSQVGPSPCKGDGLGDPPTDTTKNPPVGPTQADPLVACRICGSFVDLTRRDDPDDHRCDKCIREAEK